MYTLGINAPFHDSAACLVKDGEVVAAAEEERFTHVKHGKRPIPFSTYELPFHAVNYCLEVENIHLNDVDHIAYSFDPAQLLNGALKQFDVLTLPLRPSVSRKAKLWMSPWDPLFVSYIANAPFQLADGWPHHLQPRFRGVNGLDRKWHYVDHHLSHAASAFLVSPFERAAVMTIDGRGEHATTSYYVGNGSKLNKVGQVNMPHSLGLLYERVTRWLGFLHSSDEYKVMALASYGRPKFLEAFRSIIHVNGGGDYLVNDGDFEKMFCPMRKKHEPIEQRHFDIAQSLQHAVQDTVLHLAEWLHRETREENLCLAGGVALNCVMNAYLRDRGPFRNIWIQPAAGDAGTALGAAVWVDAQNRNSGFRKFTMDHAYLGPEYEDQEIEKFLQWTKVPYRVMDNVPLETARLLADDKIIGWFQGRMEFGPRALGSRSILASPIQPSMQARLNDVKDREDFRPVAPVVLEEDAADWFEDASYSPFMLFVHNVRPDKTSRIPAVTHVDGTARIQTVNSRQHPLYHALLKEFKRLTDVPVLVNTSFNTLGKPIVCTPRDAIECFWTSPFDALVIGSFLVEKQSTW